MTDAAIAADVSQPGDVLLNLAAQRAFDRVFAVEDVGEAGDVFVAQFLGLAQRIDVGLARTARSAVVGPMP